MLAAALQKATAPRKDGLLAAALKNSKSSCLVVGCGM